MYLAVFEVFLKSANCNIDLASGNRNIAVLTLVSSVDSPHSSVFALPELLSVLLYRDVAYIIQACGPLR